MKSGRKLYQKKWLKRASIALIICSVWYFILPDPLFNTPYSTVVTGRNGELLAGSIASDGQWRFPQPDSVPNRFYQCVIHFEDEYFKLHPGVNPVAIARAAWSNLKNDRVVSGGSTLTMQTIRLSRRGKSRNIWQKVIEMIYAVSLEMHVSKDEVFRMWTAHAPFGGNVVGLEAASWRYYGRSPFTLSWGECATLAVLPNAPSLVYPGKNQHKLFEKRNRLLDKLLENQIIDTTSCVLAKSEPLPGTPKSIPQRTPHLMTRLINDGYYGQKTVTSIHEDLQDQMNRIADKYHNSLSQNNIHNLSILIADVKSGEVISYVGNSPCKHEEQGKDVDVIMAKRSSGSILKPFLFANMLNKGKLCPNQLEADVPTRIAGFAPKNFNRSYDGAVPASEALTRSLNIPAVRMLRKYGLEEFYIDLKELGITTINKSPGHYGLSLILGGAEVTLWDVVGSYASMARVLNNFPEYSSRYVSSDIRSLSLKSTRLKNIDAFKEGEKSGILSASAIYTTFETLSGVNRPREEKGWESFASSRKIAWKTGTSFGHRDAWAIGITPDYVVGVWVGNADGEGRAGLTGTLVAGPVLFDCYKMLPKTGWFNPPWDDMKQIEICKNSGFKASVHCTSLDTMWLPATCSQTESCSYHELVHLDESEQYQVTSDCYPVNQMKTKSMFVLPPVMEWFFRQKTARYEVLPPFRSDCLNNPVKSLDLIYPGNNTKIFIPRNLDGKLGKTIFEAAHRNKKASLFWHIDNLYIGQTVRDHKLEFDVPEGVHKLTLVDSYGETITHKFEVLGR